MNATPEAHPADIVECSVVVPTHRGAHRLPELLDALTAQDYEGIWELVVVVDGLMDSTPELLALYKDRLPIVTVIHEQAMGIVRAMNDGITTARGRVVIRCDDDLTPRPSFLSLHMRHHHDHTVGVIGPTRDVFPNSAYARAYGIPATERSLKAAYARDPGYRWVGWAANNSAPREVLLRAGGFDSRFIYGQDSELGYRIASQGIEIVVDLDLETIHRGPSTSVESRAARAFVAGASRRLFNKIHPNAHPSPSAAAGFRARLWPTAVQGVARTLRNREAYGRAGRILDRFLDVMPLSMGNRMVSLLVEAAGKSGLAYGNSDLSVYKAQKVAELSSELSARLRR